MNDYDYAAKAAGLTLWWKEASCKGGEVRAPFIVGALGGDPEPWRPLASSNDALKLQVALGASVERAEDGWAARIKTARGDTFSAYSDQRDSDVENARNAIFQLAVLIGRHLQENERARRSIDPGVSQPSSRPGDTGVR